MLSTAELKKRLLSAVLLLATAWYLVHLIRQHWTELRQYRWDVDPGLLILSVLAHVAVLSWGVHVWGRVLRCFGQPPVAGRTLLRIWFISNLARYVPGKVFQFVALARLSNARGLPASVLVASAIVNAGFVLLAALIWSCWMLIQHAGTTQSASVAVGIAVPLAAVAFVHPRPSNLLLAALSRLTKRTVLLWEGSWSTGIALLGLSVLSWAFYGAAYHLFVASIVDAPLTMHATLSGVNALSFALGYASPLPGGGGLREISMASLLQLSVLPAGVGAILTLAARLWTIAAELLGCAFGVLLSPNARRSNWGMQE